MGKYASKDVDSGLIVTWTNVTGKPATFTPASHDNTAHSTAYAPVASPNFTGTVSLSDATNPNFRTTDTTNNVISKLQSLDSTGLVGTESNHNFEIRTNNQIVATFLTNGNMLVGANIIGAKLQTANYSWEEDSGDLVLKYGATIIERHSNTGGLLTKAGIGTYQAI